MSTTWWSCYLSACQHTPSSFQGNPVNVTLPENGWLLNEPRSPGLTAGRSISEQRETPNGKLWVEQPSTAWDETTSPRTYTSREDLTWTCHRHLSYIVTVLNHVLQGLEWAKVPVCHIEDHRKRTIYCLVQCFTLWSKRGNVSLWNLTLHCSLDTCEWSCRDGTALRSPTSSALLWTGKHSCVISDT